MLYCTEENVENMTESEDGEGGRRKVVAPLKIRINKKRRKKKESDVRGDDDAETPSRVVSTT